MNIANTIGDFHSGMISIVVPVYGCATCLRELINRLRDTLLSVTSHFEILLINDASPDDSWALICKLAQEDARVKGINLSRNFGQHYAITAGLDFVRGHWIVVMDCDLQDQPEEIPLLYLKALEGYDIVVGRRAVRQDSFFKKLGSRLFYIVFDYFTGTKVDNRIGNFGIYSYKVISEIRSMREQTRSFGLFALWVGFKRVEIDVCHASRASGRSGYTFLKLFRLAFDSISAHSNNLLLINIKVGVTLCLLSFVYAVWLMLRHFFFGISVQGWTSLMVSIYFTAGMIIGSLGVVGIYIGKIFEEVKSRPLYIIEFDYF